MHKNHKNFLYKKFVIDSHSVSYEKAYYLEPNHIINILNLIL